MVCRVGGRGRNVVSSLFVSQGIMSQKDFTVVIGLSWKHVFIIKESSHCCLDCRFFFPLDFDMVLNPTSHALRNVYEPWNGKNNQ